MHSPLGFNVALGRLLRLDGPDTLGVSTQTFIEWAAEQGEWDSAKGLIEYYWTEMQQIHRALFVWLEDLFRQIFTTEFGDERLGLEAALLHRLREFDTSAGDRGEALEAARVQNTEHMNAAVERMRLRYCPYHDAIVAWIEDLLAGIAKRHGEEAVLDSFRQTYKRIWKPRYAKWWEWSALERVQVCAEGLRGHLCGARRRGELVIREEDDRYVLILDPCGSCGILRRGDPESGRPPLESIGAREPHPWNLNRIGAKWYALHGPVAMVYFPLLGGRAPLRPLADCDTERACRWFVYKDEARVRPEHAHEYGIQLAVSEPGGIKK